MKKLFLFLSLFFITFINVKAEDYVNSISIDGDTNYIGFKSDKYDYQINVDSSKDNIKIEYDYNEELYRGSGAFGNMSLKYGKNEFIFTLTKIEDGSEVAKYNIVVTRPDNRSNDNSLTSLTVGNDKIILGSSNEYNVSVDGTTKSVEVRATPASGASLVDGYGERIGNNAVTLNNPTTSIEIKVKAENESIRTYKININKINLQSNDATLKSLKVEGVDFDFKSNKLEYDLSVKYNVSNVKIEAIKNHEKANVEYIDNVTLQTGINSVDIKVIAEDGTTNIYKLNITREEEVPIVKDIKITGIDFEFKPKTYNYRIETSLTKLDFNVTLSSETATSEILNNENLKNGSTIKIEAKDGNDTVTYSFRIINKEETKEKNTKEDEVVTTQGNNNDNFLKQNEMIIALLIFGLGIMSCLIAILLNRKSKVM